MKEKVLTMLENDVKDVISRFGIDVNIYPTEYGFVSDTFKMTPKIFKDIRVMGSLRITEGEEQLGVTVSLDYRYNTYRGGANGTEMCRIYYLVNKDFEKYMGNTDNYNWLFSRRYIVLPQC